MCSCGSCENCAEICPGCGEHCSECWEHICSDCGLCSDCAGENNYCFNCDYCSSCVQMCSCGSCSNCAEICPECGIRCSECNDDYCLECGKCYECAELCRDCKSFCEDCIAFCSNCNKCENCVAAVCPSCSEVCAECGDLCPECNVCSSCEEACPECNVCHTCKTDFCPNCGKCEDCIEFVYESLDDQEHSLKCDCGEDFQSEDHVFGQRSIWDPDRKWTCTICGYVCPLSKRTTQKNQSAKSLSSLDVREVALCTTSKDTCYQNAESVPVNKTNDSKSNATIDICDIDLYSNSNDDAIDVLPKDIEFDKIDISDINENRKKIIFETKTVNY